MGGGKKPRVPGGALDALKRRGAALAGLGAPPPPWQLAVRESSRGDLGHGGKTTREGPPMEIDGCGGLRVPFRWMGCGLERAGQVGWAAGKERMDQGKGEKAQATGAPLCSYLIKINSREKEFWRDFGKKK